MPPPDRSRARRPRAMPKLSVQRLQKCPICAETSATTAHDRVDARKRRQPNLCPRCCSASIRMRSLILIYLDTCLWQGRFGISGSQVAALYPACLCRTSRLLALMESADPHLICRSSSTLESRFRFSGSRSDLFAIIARRASRTLSAFLSCVSSYLPCQPSLSRLINKIRLVGSTMRQQRPNGACRLVRQRYGDKVHRPPFGQTR